MGNDAIIQQDLHIYEARGIHMTLEEKTWNRSIEDKNDLRVIKKYK